MVDSIIRLRGYLVKDHAVVAEIGIIKVYHRAAMKVKFESPGCP